jgi:hypothetical protein
VEPPETPAPVFAARAFKSALFGTPTFRDEDEFETPRRAAAMKPADGPEAAKFGIASPAKPQGILLTPGTATTRRKTVSFGEGVVDNGDKCTIWRSGMPSNCPGKFPSPWTPRVGENPKGARKSTLTRTLEAARDEKAKYSHSTKINDTDAPQPKSGTVSRSISGSESGVGKIDDDVDGDMTLDLNEPRSQSGRYWKSEYEKYHEEAKAEMKKLVKYKQLAKSYAKKKDGEAVDLGERLKEEQQKVAGMEARITELVALIANQRLSGTDDESRDLLKDLAHQTALAIEYRDQVNQFQAALQEREADPERRNNAHSEKRASSNALILGSEPHELKGAREQLAQMVSLRDEVRGLRQNLSAAERKITKLQNENARLFKELGAVSDELE